MQLKELIDTMSYGTHYKLLGAKTGKQLANSYTNKKGYIKAFYNDEVSGFFPSFDAMDDLINRDHAAQAIESYLCSQCDYDTERDPECINCPHLNGDEILKSVPIINRWIPVEDSLPENSHPVLITWANNSPVMSCYEKDKGKPFTGCAHYCNGKWYWYSQFSDDILSEYGEYQETVDVDVIAWMPMPDAYKPTEKE